MRKQKECVLILRVSCSELFIGVWVYGCLALPKWGTQCTNASYPGMLAFVIKLSWTQPSNQCKVLPFIDLWHEKFYSGPFPHSLLYIFFLIIVKWHLSMPSSQFVFKNLRNVFFVIIWHFIILNACHWVAFLFDIKIQRVHFFCTHTKTSSRERKNELKVYTRWTQDGVLSSLKKEARNLPYASTR